jgi:hypothetical protein
MERNESALQSDQHMLMMSFSTNIGVGKGLGNQIVTSSVLPPNLLLQTLLSPSYPLWYNLRTTELKYNHGEKQ